MRTNDKRVEEMYSLYKKGLSLSEVGKHYGITRQAVYDQFNVRGLKLRTMLERQSIVFNGIKYTLNNSGYFRKTTGKRSLMHRDVWEFYNGLIPVGWDIHHIDEDKTNNDLSNLECLPKAEHTRLYSPHNNQYTRGRKRKSS